MPHADPEARRAYQRRFYARKDQADQRKAYYLANKEALNAQRKARRAAARQQDLFHLLTRLTDGD